MADEFGTFLADGSLGNEFRFKRIEPIWESFDLIIFDFEGVGHMTDSFANGCFGNLAMEQYAYFLDQLRNTEDVDGKSLLHNSMVLYGSCIADGNRHNNDNIPVVLAGNAGGAFKPGRHNDTGGGTPLTNLYVRMLQEFGVKTKRFGDSTGALRKV